MLHRETVEPDTLRLLLTLMELPELADFHLVGGTALSLQLGHRNSIDLELFTAEVPFEKDSLLKILQKIGPIGEIKTSPTIIGLLLNNVKCDFVCFPYPLIDPILMEDGIRMTTPREIAAMKINAISRRGAKKDFIDLYFLLRLFSLEEMLGFYEEKFRVEPGFHARRSLVFFEDTESQALPKIFEKVTWENVKRTIERHARPLF